MAVSKIKLHIVFLLYLLATHDLLLLARDNKSSFVNQHTATTMLVQSRQIHESYPAATTTTTAAPIKVWWDNLAWGYRPLIIALPFLLLALGVICWGTYRRLGPPSTAEMATCFARHGSHSNPPMSPEECWELYGAGWRKNSYRRSAQDEQARQARYQSQHVPNNDRSGGDGGDGGG